jgi:hypothetical protein
MGTRSHKGLARSAIEGNILQRRIHVGGEHDDQR